MPADGDTFHFSTKFTSTKELNIHMVNLTKLGLVFLFLSFLSSSTILLGRYHSRVHGQNSPYHGPIQPRLALVVGSWDRNKKATELVLCSEQTPLKRDMKGRVPEFYLLLLIAVKYIINYVENS